MFIKGIIQVQGLLAITILYTAAFLMVTVQFLSQAQGSFEGLTKTLISQTALYSYITLNLTLSFRFLY